MGCAPPATHLVAGAVLSALGFLLFPVVVGRYPAMPDAPAAPRRAVHPYRRLALWLTTALQASPRLALMT